MDVDAWRDEEYYWPIRFPTSLARSPHEYDTWYGPGHTVTNGVPPEPFTPGTELSGFLIVPPTTVPDAFRMLEISPERRIQFYALVPLHTDEMDLELREGTEALLEALERARVGDVVDPKRSSVARKETVMPDRCEVETAEAAERCGDSQQQAC
ncbi:MAG TPA: suppressor of fused domain protein [Longimicrobiales bacterium]